MVLLKIFAFKVLNTHNSNIGIDSQSIVSASFAIYPYPAINNLTIECLQKSTIEILNIQGLMTKNNYVG